MKKAIGIIILGLLWCNVGATEEQKKTIDTSEFEGVISPEAEPYSGHSIKNSDGLSMLYSTKHRKYISCKKFNDEEIEIDYEQQLKELKEDDPNAFLIFGSRSVCHGDERRGEDGTIEVYDEKNNIWIQKPTLSERIQKHINSESIKNLIGLIIILLLIKFRKKIKKSINSSFSKIKSSFSKIKSSFSKIKSSKKDWKRIMLTLSILYLCLMYYLNWWGHQGGMFIYKLTYTWFLKWGLIPVVSGWIIYYIWRKEK